MRVRGLFCRRAREFRRLFAHESTEEPMGGDHYWRVLALAYGLALPVWEARDEVNHMVGEAALRMTAPPQKGAEPPA
jgi:hypothetical protein